MLVLTREVNESVRIGPSIKVMVVRVQNGKVRLGIVAPDDVAVHRSEVWEEMEAEGKDPSLRGKYRNEKGD